MSAAIVFDNVTKYGVAENFCCIIEKKECVLFRTGDTAILRLAAGIDRPDSGSVILLDTELSALSERNAAAFRNEQIGYAGQDSVLFRELTVLENTSMQLTLRGISRNERDNLAKGTLTTLGLSSVMHNYPGTLSVLQKRKVLLARAFTAEPEILLLGDLFAGLQENEAEELAGCINIAYLRDGFTVLICAAKIPSQLKPDREEKI